MTGYLSQVTYGMCPTIGEVATETKTMSIPCILAENTVQIFNFIHDYNLFYALYLGQYRNSAKSRAGKKYMIGIGNLRRFCY